MNVTVLFFLTHAQEDREGICNRNGHLVPSTCKLNQKDKEVQIFEQSWIPNSNKFLWVFDGSGKGKTLFNISGESLGFACRPSRIELSGDILGDLIAFVVKIKILPVKPTGKTRGVYLCLWSKTFQKVQFSSLTDLMSVMMIQSDFSKHGGRIESIHRWESSEKNENNHC
ncbi:uncharacterized protein Bfra_002993 [Botrytis fragariae]|uniref:Uncharacterized protein n=1 Tax=Botrytis fragariae TaxID=1964551 RepID=A0A8H6ELG7_9HELO|nr:uncharacterized protein Bfra_002993 [Botrytis fragariae]KAF5876588.1 hypothetical protein Bfra_002993 [Botrytis fragariae]